MKKRLTRLWVLGGIGLVVVGLGWSQWLSSQEVQLQTQRPSRANVENTVQAIGAIQPQRYVNVGAQVSGQIMHIHVQPGEKVQQGDLLVEIDPSVQQAVVDSGRAAIAHLQAQLKEQQALHELALLKHKRQQRLLQQGATQLEQAQTAHAEWQVTGARKEALQAQITQMQASQRAEETRLSYTRIYASMAGTVVAVEAKEGQTLNATYQTPNILRIADLSVMTVWAEVSEADVSQVKAGLPVYFSTLSAVEGEQQRWHSKVRQVLPAPVGTMRTDESTELTATKAVTYTVLFDVDNNDGRLMPQMTAQVTFVIDTAEEALVVPLSWLQRRGEHYVVRLKHGEEVIEQPIQLGVRSRHVVQVIAGLTESDYVVMDEIETKRGWSWLQW